MKRKKLWITLGIVAFLGFCGMLMEKQDKEEPTEVAQVEESQSSGESFGTWKRQVGTNIEDYWTLTKRDGKYLLHFKYKDFETTTELVEIEAKPGEKIRLADPEELELGHGIYYAIDNQDRFIHIDAYDPEDLTKEHVTTLEKVK